jgi:5-formyltetrahydrofolate cyclo-ligase
MPIKHYKDIRIQKNIFREKSKEYRENLSADEKLRLDKKISNRFLNLWHFRDSELLMTYVSTSIEVDTVSIIKRALESGKRVAVPYCIAGTRNIDYYLIKSLDDLAPGTFGVLEPVIENCNKLEVFDGALCLVPALSYDVGGYRLGFGKGYYDRFLTNVDIKKIGICYDSCLFDEVPRGRYDKKVNMIVTESRIIDLSSSNSRQEI